jgi:hypothetical protein
MSTKTIRIGLGSPESPKSTLWTITVGGSEVYIAQRFTFSLAKISLHSSGKWRFAVNSDKWIKDSDRALVKWDRPQPVVGKWVMGPTIVFSPMAAKKPLKIKDLYNKEIEWLQAPTGDQERVLLIAFSEGQMDLSELLQFTKITPDYIESISLKNRPKLGADTTWIISWIQPMTEHTKKEVYEVLARLKIQHKPGADMSGTFGVATPFNLPNDEERRRGLSPTTTIREIILGEHNLKVESKFNEGAYVHVRSLGLIGYITRIIGHQWLICNQDIVVDPSINNMLDAIQEARKFANKDGTFLCTAISGAQDDSDDVELLSRP